ncbi:hypothetical protein [Kitasatospora sp. NPDC017646]|uniref:hypothetical protein n=1 Tax=Kitasatospora sp. NPDC017646 TaxID=3364024 RepID=UPI0037BAB5B3
MRSTPRSRRRAGGLAATGTAAAALDACRGSSGSSGSSGSGMSSTSSGSGTTLRTARDPEPGTIVTDSAGFTLYRSDQDETNPPESYCNGNCATVRPPEQAHGNVTAQDIDGKPAGTWFAVTPTDGRAVPSGGPAPGSPGPANPPPMPGAPGH